jgi:hypothetical protein
MYDIVSYGADPTGATDSTAAIQAAINAASAAGGGTVHVPEGTFTVTGIYSAQVCIAIPDNIHIQGENWLTS